MDANAFKVALEKVLKDETSTTENGATGFKTTGHKLLDLHFQTSSLRSKSEAEVLKMFEDAFSEEPENTVKWLFMCRDVRGGMGERRTFRICFKWLANCRPALASRLVHLISEYGRWDDLMCLLDSNVDETVQVAALKVIDTQLASDYAEMQKGNGVSLLAKWMPSVNTSSKETVALAKRLVKKLSFKDDREYRKTLSALRKHIDVVERKMSAKQWGEIDYEKVPSMANVRYRNAFLKNDPERRREYLDKLASGEAKVNATACFPSDIVHAYSADNENMWRLGLQPIDATLEQMWKSLPSVDVKGNVLVIADGSGSMMTQAGGGSSMTALEVCNALALYCAEHNDGQFKDKFITFSGKPQFVDVSKAQSLREKLSIMLSHDDCSNTNLEATFDLVLEAAVRGKLKQEDIPTLVICSDMEFDAGVDLHSYDWACKNEDGNWNDSKYNAAKTALMEMIRAKWAAAGYELPKLVWWNIASRTGTIPMQQNKAGVVLCSGYSQSMFKMLASDSADPYEALLEQLNIDRYKLVAEVVSTANTNS